MQSLSRFRSRWAIGVILVAVGIAPAFGEAPPSPRPAQIDRNGTLILIRASLLALQQANETGNYTVLRDLGAPGFQQANTAAHLGEVFASLRTQKLDLSGVIVLDPQLTILPQIESSGLMHIAGVFPSVPTQINFELLYAPVDSRWRLYGISVKLGSSLPVAPTAASPAPQPTKVDPPKPKRKPRTARPADTAKPASEPEPEPVAK